MEDKIMPILEITVDNAEKTWTSPDGKRTIYSLDVLYQGKPMKAKTFSRDIAQKGWTGEVETREQNGDTFVKQPFKEQPGGYKPQGGGSFGSRKPQSDNFTMYLSYAKDIALHMIDDKGNLDGGKYGEVLDAVANGGKTLYEARPDAPKDKGEEKFTGTKDLDEQPVSDDLAKAVDDVFGPQKEKEKSWEEPTKLPS